jgi:AraC-like DNA-binding protein
VPPPESLFHGLLCQQSLAPDNIIFMQRSGVIGRSAEGVTNNYHHRFELVTALERAGPVRIDRTSFTLQPGECALIFPNQFHHYMDAEVNHPGWLFITFDLRNSVAIQALKDSPRVLDEAALRLLEAGVAEFVEPPEGQPDTLSISYLLSRLLRHLVTQPELPRERRDIHSSRDVRDVLLEKIDHYVREHLTQAVTISQLATELGYSVSHLRAVFRDRLGVSLGRYMRESRLSEAAQLLQKSEFNVSEIGERCGFESLYAFSRAFRKAYGIPPRSYRQLVSDSATPPAAVAVA